MTVTEKIQSILEGAATITAVVPADRIRVPGDWQGIENPYIIHFPVALTNIRTHQGLAAMRMWDNYQVSCFASAMSVCEDLSYIVKTVLDGVTADGVSISWIGWRYAYEGEDVKLHEIALDFEVAEAL